MPRGCNNKKPKVSEVKWAARKIPKANHGSNLGRRVTKPTTIKDERPSQLVVAKRTQVAPEWAKLSKGEHTKIPGTRIQCIRLGVAVRIILEDGKKFPPHKVRAATGHLQKLAEQAREKKEIERMINGSNGNNIAAPADPVEAAPIQKSTSASSSAPAPGRGSKKERKEAAWRERQQKLSQMHAAKVQEDGRELVSQEWCEGEVVQKVQSRAWVKVSNPAQLPAHVLSQLRTTSAEIRSQLQVTDGELLPIYFSDLVDSGLDLKPGVALLFKVYKDKTGVGGCEAKPAPKVVGSPAKKRAATGDTQAGSGKKSKQSPAKGGAPDDSAAQAVANAEQDREAEASAKAKAEEDRLAAEASAKADRDRLAAEAAAKVEQERLAAEASAKAKAEEDRLAAEASAKAERDRLAAEAAAKVEQDRLAAEASAKAKAEEDRLAAEASAKAERDRLAAEAAARAEQDRLAAEASAKAKAEQDRVAAEASSKAKAEQDQNLI